MNAFIKIPTERRQQAFLQVDESMGLQAFSVEKDFWVCWTLRELFTMSGIGGHLTFKGGTSLSKAWKLIQRFSEDIDLIVDKDVLGFGGDAAPDKASSNKQRKMRLESLMESCRQWVQGTLQPGLADRITDALGPDGGKLEVDSDMPDGQCLLSHGWITPRTSQVPSASLRPQTISPAGGPTIRTCSGQCSSAILPPLKV